MFRLPALEYRPIFHDVPLSPEFEQFVHAMLAEMIRRSLYLTAERIAEAFRKHFHVPIPVTDLYIDRLITEEIGIEIIAEPIEGLEATCRFNSDRGQYEICTPYNPNERVIGLLHDLFEVFYGRCFSLKPQYAEGWLADQKAAQAHCLADLFAYAVVVPAVKFREEAKASGFNPYTLANRFKVRPGVMVQAVSRYAILPCPMLIVRVGVAEGSEKEDDCDLNGLLPLLFVESGTQWKVWTRLYKKARSVKSQSLVMQYLADQAPKKGQPYTPVDFIAQAIEKQRPLAVATERLFSVNLPEAVFAVARPGGKSLQNCFVQVVPWKHGKLLMDEVLREEQERKARTPACSS